MTAGFSDQRYHQPMSDVPPNGPPGGARSARTSPVPPPPPPWPPAQLRATPRLTQWSSFAALAIALISLGVAAAAWLRPPPEARTATESPPTFTDEQVAQAKANICAEFNIVNRAIVINTHRTNPTPSSEIGDLVTGLYGNVTIYQGGDYLLDLAATEPAVPSKLGDAIRSLGNAMKRLGVIDLTLETDSVRDPLLTTVNNDIILVDQLCK